MAPVRNITRTSPFLKFYVSGGFVTFHLQLSKERSELLFLPFFARPIVHSPSKILSGGVFFSPATPLCNIEALTQSFIPTEGEW